MRSPRCALPMISRTLSSSGTILLRQTFTCWAFFSDIPSQGRHVDDVGVDAGSSAIASAQAVIISRFRSQPGYVPARHVAHIEALISAHETAKGTAFGYIQPIARRSGYTAPVSCEPALGVGCGYAGRSRRRHGRHSYDVGVDAGSCATEGTHPIIIGLASAQPAHTPADHGAQVEILIAGQETAKGTAGGHIQQVAR